MTGIVHNYLIGSCVHLLRLNGNAYLPELLEDVPLIVRNNMWCLHNCASAHFTCAVQQHLNDTSPGQWVWHGGLVAWPPRLPDVTPIDFFL
ncbi:hypothetical protein PR048_021708 [Dryococelus australis]|uniref:Uncharacterized protein n=1 Tax=Dryococelus australis TaxID=614101 RepID=A0ABQ9GYX8_9NEOP|nr:hypothetical protein PR048_021708 [Dryococelus australis]